MVVSGNCNPYATVTLTWGKGQKEVRRSVVKKKTTSPQFQETVYFDVSIKTFRRNKKHSQIM